LIISRLCMHPQVKIVTTIYEELSMTGLLRTSNSIGDAWLFYVVSQLTGGFFDFLVYFI
jgi:hypothetical protein